MTRLEAIAILDGFKYNPLLNNQHYEALDIAISALSENKGDLISRQAVFNIIEKEQFKGDAIAEIEKLPSVENKGEWIPFSKELPPKHKKVHVSTFGIVTIGERTSEANEKLRLSILDPMNNRYTNVDPYVYQITRWQPLPEPYKAEREDKE